MTQRIERPWTGYPATYAAQDYRQLVGRSVAVRQLEEDIHCATRTDVNVLITGESGVGKEFIARLIHEKSSRAKGPFVVVNCVGANGSTPDTEWNGWAGIAWDHETAKATVEGPRVGTIFLKEAGELVSRMQVAVLHFLETRILEGDVQRGVNRIDLRPIAATTRNLRADVEAKIFSEDLFYRLNTIHLIVPPLRDRPEDISALVLHYLHAGTPQRMQVPDISAGALRQLMDYTWPGNVRELRRVVDALIRRAGSDVVTAADLPVNIGELS